MGNITIIRIRRGNEKLRYFACDNAGNPLRGFHRLSDIRRHWKDGIRQGRVSLIRELDKSPDWEALNGARESVHALLIRIREENRVKREKQNKRRFVS